MPGFLVSPWPRAALTAPSIKLASRKKTLDFLWKIVLASLLCNTRKQWCHLDPRASTMLCRQQDIQTPNSRGLAVLNDSQTAELVQLLTGHQADIYLYIRSLVFDVDHASEHSGGYKPHLVAHRNTFQIGTNFRAWAFQIARHKVMEWRRGGSATRWFSPRRCSRLWPTTRKANWNPRTSGWRTCATVCVNSRPRIVN